MTEEEKVEKERKGGKTKWGKVPLPLFLPISIHQPTVQ